MNTDFSSPPISVLLRRSARSKRFSLRISRLDGRVTLSVPLHASSSDIKQFLMQQESWLREKLADISVPATVRAGVLLPIEGRMVGLRHSNGAWPVSAQLTKDALWVSGPIARAGIKAETFLKMLARDRLVTACDLYSKALGKSYTKLSLRDARSRWGSCSADRKLMFSWRLIMAPPCILNYVAAHEVAHLVRMDHSPVFWKTVEAICPNWRAHRDWLRKEGHSLHKYRFILCNAH